MAAMAPRSAASVTLLALVVLMAQCVCGESWTLKVDLTSPPIHETNPHFIGFNLDTSSFSRDIPAILGSAKAHTLLKGLSPSVLRVGGTEADYFFFNRPQKVLDAAGLSPSPLTMSTSNWDFLVNLTSSTNLRLLFCLNLDLRFGVQWNPSQAIELFEYSKAKGYGANLDWELGNEPFTFAIPGAGGISGDRLGDDFLSLKRIIQSYDNLASSRLVGPDVVEITKPAVEAMMRGVANKAGGQMDAFTFHHYYFRGDVAKWQEYINPAHFDTFASSMAHVKSVLKNTSHPNMTLWLGETSDAWHSGTAGVSDRYISGFLWLDKLGLSARLGLGVILRQTFNGGDYALTDSSMNPNPDYWLSLTYNRLVGPKVLSVDILNYTHSPPTLRAYAQCTAKSAQYPPGSVTLFVLSVSPNVTETLTFSGPLGSQRLDYYLLTPYGPGGLLAKSVALNGKLMELIDDHTLPDLGPVKGKSASDGFKLPPCTFGFLVFFDAKSPACM